jgi:hypothetical protein
MTDPPNTSKGSLLARRVRIASTTLVTSFIVGFGVVKAFTYLLSGHFADVYGRNGCW